MTAYSFKRRFIAPLWVGLGRDPALCPVPVPAGTRPKRQTIRSDRNNGHASYGWLVHLYYAQRTKECRLLGLGICMSADRIVLDFTVDRVFVDGSRLNSKLDAFARADGFESWDAMRAFWREEHDRECFDGVLIKWVPRFEQPPAPRRLEAAPC